MKGKLVRFPPTCKTFRQACEYIAPLIAEGYKVVVWSFTYSGSAYLRKG